MVNLNDLIGQFERDLNARRAEVITEIAKHVPIPKQQIENAIPKVILPEINLPLGTGSASPVTHLPPIGERILGSAAAHRGKRYVWAGDTFNTFDCSALTQRAHRDQGIAIGRTTHVQINQGREIPWGQHQIGDLVFSRFSAPNTPEHVSIWAGNGKVFEAGDPLDYYVWGNRGTVRVRRMW